MRASCGSRPRARRAAAQTTTAPSAGAGRSWSARSASTRLRARRTATAAPVSRACSTPTRSIRRRRCRPRSGPAPTAPAAASATTTRLRLRPLRGRALQRRPRRQHLRRNGNCASGFCRIIGPHERERFVRERRAGRRVHRRRRLRERAALHRQRLLLGRGRPGLHDRRAVRERHLHLGPLPRRRAGLECEDDADCDDGCASPVAALPAACSRAATRRTTASAGLRCVRQVCSDGSQGMPCTVDAECTVLACADGACSDGANGAPCNADDECTSNRCADPPGAVTGECTSGASGAYCVVGRDCVSIVCAIDGTCE